MGIEKGTLETVTMRNDIDLYLFGEGKNYEVYRRMGAHPARHEGKEGVYFSVWAPNAVKVSVIGSFNGWKEGVDCLCPIANSGIYDKFIPGVILGDKYKFCITDKAGRKHYKSDPYGFENDLRPQNSSKVTDLSGYHWHDGEWCKKKQKKDWHKEPMSVYEVHPGSWKKISAVEGEIFYNYRQLAHELADYVEEMGYTHIELMGICEHPYDGSWGYQVTGYFAPTSRYGGPRDFMYFVDYMHSRGIGVILDWVPAHFPKDEHGLALFDGGPLYEYGDSRKGEHPDWGTKVFNYESAQVRNFLIASAVYWLKEYHVDGLRVDAVSSMLYLDYGRGPGQWIPNCHGGNQNLEAVSFLQELNAAVKKQVPGSFMIAEESTSWPMVTGDQSRGGLGFDFKWNMGWMNDTLMYLQKDPVYRKYHHDSMTFGLVYAYSENFILPYSHDEVVHGKKTMLEKMPGDLKEKFEGLKTAYTFMIGHPGKKLLFMGQEFAQPKEWNEDQGLDWDLLEEKEYRGIQVYVRELLKVYRQYPCLYEWDDNPCGFKWIEADDKERSIFSFVRNSENGKRSLVFLLNFTPVDREDYPLEIGKEKKCRLVLDSSMPGFGKDSGRDFQTEEKTFFRYCLKGMSAAVFEMID